VNTDYTELLKSPLHKSIKEGRIKLGYLCGGEKIVAKECKECGARLGVYQRAFWSECQACYLKRAMAESQAREQAQAKLWAERWERLTRRWFPAKKALGNSRDLQNTRKPIESILPDESWVEAMLGISWISSFVAAAIFGLLAYSELSDSYGDPTSIFIYIACTLSLVISGILFAAIGKIIALLSISNAIQTKIFHSSSTKESLNLPNVNIAENGDV